MDDFFKKYQHLLQQKNAEKNEIITLLEEFFPHKKWKAEFISIEKKVLTIILSSSEKYIFVTRGGVRKCEEKGYRVILR